jgi:hypothetical protein
MDRISHGKVLKRTVAFVLLLALVSGLAAGAGMPTQAVSAGPVHSAAAQDPNLCALLPSGAGWSISGANPTQSCSATNTGATTGDYKDLKEAEITKYASPQAAQAQLKSLFEAATRNGFGRWDATTNYGDPGFGYDIIPINLSDPGGAFTRGPYLVMATARRGTGAEDPGNAHRLLRLIDNALSGARGETPPEALRIILAGQKTACSFKTTQAGWLYVMGGPAKNKRHTGPGVFERFDAPVFYQTDDATEFRIDTDRFGMRVPPTGALTTAQFGYAPRNALPVYYGTEIRIPGLAPQYDDRWYLNIELGPNELHQLGPMGSFKIPCVPAEAVKITAGILETLIKLEAGKTSRKIDAGNAVITPKGNGLFTAASANVSAQANNYGVRIMVDARDPATSKVSIYQGTAEVAHKNNAIPPVTLNAGQSVQISQGAITPPVTVVEVPGIDSQTFPETGKAAAGIFMSYWLSHGGLAQQGFPISGLIRERSDLNGQTYTVQYFERAVFEFHPEYAAPNDVLLSQLGTFQYKRKYPQGAPGQRPNTSSGSRLFPETGKRVGGLFLNYWNNNGGLAQQGLPISDEFMEVSETDGKTYLVQYFERAVFEHHPENAGKPSEVLLSLLGVFFHKQKYGGGQPPPQPPPGVTPTTPSGGQQCSLTTNIAGAANGGSIAGVSSNYGGSYAVEQMIDGTTNRGWSTTSGAVKDQYFVVALPRGETYSINKVRLNGYSTYKDPPNSIRNFQIRVSTTDASPASFRTVFSGTSPREDRFVDYTFGAAQARYVMLFVVDNYGGSFIEGTEFEVYQAQPCGPVGGPPPPTTVVPPGGQPTATTPSGNNPCANVPASQNMTITPSNCARAGTTFRFEGFGFLPNERVGVYATGPNGQVIGAEFQVVADANGRTTGASGVRLETQANSPQGTWALTMEGVSSGRRAIGYIMVLPP